MDYGLKKKKKKKVTAFSWLILKLSLFHSMHLLSMYLYFSLSFLLSFLPSFLLLSLPLSLVPFSFFHSLPPFLSSFHPSFFLTFPYFLALQDVPDSFYIFLAPVLGAAIFPKIPGSFCWRMILETKGLDSRCVCCYWDVTVSRPSHQLTELSGTCVYTNLVYISKSAISLYRRIILHCIRTPHGIHPLIS